MMRKVFSVALMATWACVFGLAQSANAGVTIDVVFRDGTAPTGITILPGDVGPGCTFSGYYNAVQATGRCMDVVLKTTDQLIQMGASVDYSSTAGLALMPGLVGFQEWRGVGVSFDKTGAALSKCSPMGGIIEELPGKLVSFDCLINPNNPPTLAAGTYNIGTIVWDASGTVAGVETIAAYFKTGFDSVGAVINGVVVDISTQVVLGSHTLNIIPEPGTASLLGLGLVGLIVAGRRSR